MDLHCSRYDNTHSMLRSKPECLACLLLKMACLLLNIACFLLKMACLLLKIADRAVRPSRYDNTHSMLRSKELRYSVMDSGPEK